MSFQQNEIRVEADDGHSWMLLSCVPAQPWASLLWLPALGVAARHYLPFAESLATRNVAVFLHEWRGNGSSNLRPTPRNDWGYREMLTLDLPRSQAAISTSARTRLLGGHSLGGQLASCFAGQLRGAFAGLWLVASGTPYWRTFPPPHRYALPLVYRFLPWLAQRQGVLHGRRLGFGGTEARGLIRDWARVGLTNRYAAAGMTADLEADMATFDGQLHGVFFSDDWLAPISSLEALAAKMPGAGTCFDRLDANQLGTRADHFAWMKQPDAVAQRLSEDGEKKIFAPQD